jgi:hypothetical protein
VTSGAAAAVMQRKATGPIVNVASVIATDHISLCHCLVESKTSTMSSVALNLSVKELQEALRIRREIEALEKRLARLLRGKLLSHRRIAVGTPGADLTPAVRKRWARIRGKAKGKSDDIETENPGTRRYYRLSGTKA